MDYLVTRGEKTMISRCMGCKTLLQTLSRGLRKKTNKRRVWKDLHNHFCICIQ